MEPFLSRDGATLFFNNRNHPPSETDLHWAIRLDDLHFRYQGRIAGANSNDLDGVATMAGDRFCFISPRAYAQTLATVHCGAWRDGDVVDVELQASATPRIPGRVVFDVELDATGRTMIIADGHFTGGPVPTSADLRLARFDGGYRLEPSSDGLFANINTGALEYAAALSADDLTLSFTRADPAGPSLWISQRATAQSPFGPPHPVDAITGFVEAATFAPDGAIYFHKMEGGRFTLWRAARK
jgi:hypothetical protein